MSNYRVDGKGEIKKVKDLSYTEWATVMNYVEGIPKSARVEIYQNPIYVKNDIENFDNGGIIRPGIVRDALTSNSVSSTINVQKQNRHIPNSNGFIEGRSRLTVSLEEAQELVDKLKGTGRPVFDGNTGEWLRKERVETDKIIGIYVNPMTGEEIKTNKFMIVYSKTGSHIIPRKE